MIPNIQFFSTCTKPGTVTHMSSGSKDDIVNLKIACFGEDVIRGSRTVLYCETQNKPKAPVCNLREGTCENVALDLRFAGATSVSFSLGGNNPSPIFLSGFIEPLIETVGFSDEEELEEEAALPAGSKRSAPEPSVEDEPPKKKVKDTPKEKDEEEEKKQEEVSPEKTEKKSEAEPVVPCETPAKKEAKTTPTEEKPKEKKKSTPNKKKNKKRKKFTFHDNGVGIRTLKKGSDPAAKKGDTVRVRYIGQLENGEIFDKNLGEGFVVKLGGGEVIKGWETGLTGVRANEKRKLIIPADLAYGEEGDENIPPNSELWFTVECLEVLRK